MTWVAVLLAGQVLLGGCASALGSTEKGAVLGAGTGAAIGAMIGKQSGETSKGAIIGAAVGGVAGAVIGREIEAQARTLRENLENAKVEQEGEEVRITFDSGILFDFDSARLKPEARASLDELARTLLQYPGYEVEVAGHTDAKGRAEYNQRLSELRAAAAADHLMARGVPASRIRTLGWGATRPVDTNATEAGRQANRRVEVKISASEAYRRQVEGSR